MNKFFIFILCLCCVFTSAWAEGDDHTSLNPSDANIVGHILDKKTGEHLSFINVYLHGTTIGTTTDATGHYYMKNLPEGKYTLVMKSIGYKTEEKTVTLKKGKTLEINFNAEEDAVSLDPPSGSFFGKCTRLQGVRDYARHFLGRRSELPARRACGE